MFHTQQQRERVWDDAGQGESHDVNVHVLELICGLLLHARTRPSHRPVSIHRLLLLLRFHSSEHKACSMFLEHLVALTVRKGSRVEQHACRQPGSQAESTVHVRREREKSRTVSLNDFPCLRVAIDTSCPTLFQDQQELPLAFAVSLAAFSSLL